MKLATANKIGRSTKSQSKVQAQTRIVLLALASFLLGVAATAFWFHVTAKRVALVPNPQTTPQAAEQSAMASAPSRPAQAFVEKPAPVPQSAIEDVKRALPNYASLSLDQGTEVLRQAALKKFAVAARELQTQVGEAEDELKKAESKSPTDQEAAMQHLRQVQAEQSQKLRVIGGELQTQIAALKQLKGAAQ